MPRHRRSYWRSTLHMFTPHCPFFTSGASWRSYATGASPISISPRWCHPHLVVLGTLSVDPATVLTHLPHCSLGGHDRTYPRCFYLQCFLSRLDIRLLMITTDHHRRAPCGPVVMYILKRRNDFWTLPMLPLAQPH